MYNAARVGLFVICLVLGAVAGLRGIALLVVALLVSGVLSYFLLGRQRVAMGEAVAGAVQRSREKLAERTAREDTYVDEMLAARQGSRQGPRQGSDDITRSAR